jgi:hypothetical protein
MHDVGFCIKQFRFVLIFFFSITQITFSMEPNQALSMRYFNNKPIYTHHLFDLSKKPKDAFSVAMIISPIKDDNSVLIGKKGGTISRFSIENKQEDCLIQHHAVKHIPLFVVAEKKGSLLLVSAVNYNDVNNQKQSECCIWYEGCLKTKNLGPLQAIAVDRQGDLLITADQSQFISIIDLNMDKVVGSRYFLSVGTIDSIIDVAFGPDSTKIIVARTNGIALMDWNGNSLKSSFQVKNIVDIKNIYFPTYDKVLYTTRDKKVNMLDILDALNKAESDIKPTVCFEASLHDQITVDAEGGSAALWTKDKNALDYLHHEIVLRKRHHNKIEEFILEVPPFGAQYEYESKKGSLKYSNNHLCQVALRGNNVVTLGSDGTLHWWKTAEDKVPNIVETVEIQSTRKKSSPRVFSLLLSKTETRNRSKSESPKDKDHKKSSLLSSFLTVSDGESESSKKSSPRPISPTKISPRYFGEEKNNDDKQRLEESLTKYEQK